MNADGNLASAAECGQSRALCRDGEARVGVVEKCHGRERLHIASANFDGQRALAGSGTKILRIEALAHPIGFAQAVETGGGEQNRVDLALGQLAQARVDIAAKFDSFYILAQSLQLSATALAAGADAGVARQLGEAGVLDGDEDVARVGTDGRGRERETWPAVQWANP